jgi:hypothetical protein
LTRVEAEVYARVHDPNVPGGYAYAFANKGTLLQPDPKVQLMRGNVTDEIPGVISAKGSGLTCTGTFCASNIVIVVIALSSVVFVILATFVGYWTWTRWFGPGLAARRSRPRIVGRRAGGNRSNEEDGIRLTNLGDGDGNNNGSGIHVHARPLPVGSALGEIAPAVS